MGHTLGALHLRRRRAMSPASQATDHSLPAAKTRPLDHLSLRKCFGTLNGAFQAFSRISDLIKGHTAIQISGNHGFKFRHFGIFPNFRFSRFWLKYKLLARGPATRFPNFGKTDTWTRFPIIPGICLSIRNDRKKRFLHIGTYLAEDHSMGANDASKPAMCGALHSNDTTNQFAYTLTHSTQPMQRHTLAPK